MDMDTVEIVRLRLADGRTIDDASIHELVAEIDRLRGLELESFHSGWQACMNMLNACSADNGTAGEWQAVLSGIDRLRVAREQE